MQNKITAFNLGISFFIIVALAMITSDIISAKLTGLFPKHEERIASFAPVAGREDLLAYSPILEKGLFGKATQGRLSPLVTAPAQSAAATSPADLVLMGTALGSSRETFVLVLKTSTNEERVFRLGEKVFDLGPLVSVGKESAVVLSGGRRVKLLTPAAAPDRSGKNAARTNAGAGGINPQMVAPGSYVIDQRALNAALDNIGQAMTDARLLPSMKGGKVEGFRLSEVKPAGIFGMVGMKNGDVLLRINDFNVDSPEKAMQSLASLKGQSKIKLDLVRDGQPTTLNYDIR